MADPTTCTPYVAAAPRHVPMRVAPFYQEIASRPVDLEMFGVSITIQSMEIVSEVQNYTANVTKSLLSRFPCLEGVQETLRYESSRLWGWLQQKLGDNEEAPVTSQELLPFRQLVEFQLKLQHMPFITENFVDIKTQLQLMHATLDDLQQKGERVDKDLKRLHELLKDISTCRCDPRDRCTFSNISATAPSLSRKSKSKSRRSGVRPSETLMLQVDRLDVPIRDVVKTPTAVQEDSCALLSQIVETVDGGCVLLGLLMTTKTPSLTFYCRY